MYSISEFVCVLFQKPVCFFLLFCFVIKQLLQFQPFNQSYSQLTFFNEFFIETTADERRLAAWVERISVRLDEGRNDWIFRRIKVKAHTAVLL